MEFWKNVFHETNGNMVLELACGTGRLAQILLREGANYTGIEIHPEFVSASRKKLSSFGDSVSIITGDIRSFNLEGKFDLIFIGFNSFLHLLTDKEAINCLRCVQRNMHKNSRLIIDIYIPDPLFLYRPEKMRFPVLEYTDSNLEEHVYIEESNVYNSKTEVNELIWYFSTKNNKDFDVRRFYMRMYFPSKMNQMLIDSGFKICHQWGDYNRMDLNDASKLQIYDVVLGNL